MGDASVISGSSGARQLDILAGLRDGRAELDAPDEWFRWLMRWHFSDETGSPFWLERRDALGFDPRDLEGPADLPRFGTFDKEPLRRQSVRALIPRGLARRSGRVFETGGTTGSPCRVVDITTGDHNVTMYQTMLEWRGLAHGDVLAMTPGGPHAYGTFVQRLATARGSLAFHIDFDPRWVKALHRADASAAPYVRHLCDQTTELLETQRPTLLFTTSALLLELVTAISRPLASFGVRAVCTGGTACTDEERHYVTSNHLAGVQWIDTYGNTLVGHALQGDPHPGEPRYGYYLPPPFGWLRVVDPDDWREEVGPGERGRVLATTLFEDLFIPNLLERDTAERAGPHPWFPWDGVRAIGAYLGDDSEPVTPGVY